MDKNSFNIESFCKKAGGRKYRIVRFFVNGTLIEVGDFQYDTDEKAMAKACEALSAAKEIANDYIKNHKSNGKDNY